MTGGTASTFCRGHGPTCHGADYSWRVDTQDSYDFILPFLD